MLRYDDHMGTKLPVLTTNDRMLAVQRALNLINDVEENAHLVDVNALHGALTLVHYYDELMSLRARVRDLTKGEAVGHPHCDNCDGEVSNRWLHWIGDNPSAPNDEWSCQKPDWRARAKKAEAQVEFSHMAYKKAFDTDPTDLFESGPTQAKQLHELMKKFDLRAQELKRGETRERKGLCPNCGKPDPDNDHWDDLDGPNVAGWACPRS